MKLKSDAQQFVDYLDNLKTQQWLGQSRKWWPKYLFHYTDVNNAVEVLRNGVLLSRRQLETNGGMMTDNASPDVIGQTDGKWKDFVRFYFRPKTPTQYNNEGFRPVAERRIGGAHCPVPIFFLFDSSRILTMEKSLFSAGSLAVQNPYVFCNASDFINLPFQKIYHNTWYDPTIDYDIKFHRHAEVIVPQRCDLDHLKFIVCRSVAEKETLIQLLPNDVHEKYKNIIRIDGKSEFFHSYWTYVEKVNLEENSITFQFNKGEKVKGTFQVHLSIKGLESGDGHHWKDPNFRPTDTQRINLVSFKKAESYSCKLYLDNQLAYSGTFHKDNSLPF
ncbi:hypothetical protein CBW65_01490 [Tumebacillus avium]|uniref:DarT domain-containing protein n=1 Tax=Tumebacillus avium TaxID=1903704 RepID=A0A1Y0IJ81_9BACL|nr:DarT ssDNA thymidine ADP-ribosyltransferase family protein [Tumebacillus avium]ARU59876.1 hypothetical protein CBW65_01490 [Tumebacillus avium]